MASRSNPAGRQRVWMQMAQATDIDLLRKRLAELGPLWSEWEYKLHRGRIIIYSPVIPLGEDSRRDPAARYLAKHLRISPDSPGPFILEFYRHTGQWCPLGACPPGTIGDIAGFIERDTTGWCRPMDQTDWEKQQAGADNPEASR